MPWMSRCPWIAAFMVVGAVAAAADGTTNNVGTLRVSAASVVITPERLLLSDARIRATVQLTIANTGPAALRLAIFRPLSLQFEAANDLDFTYRTITGMTQCGVARVADCDRRLSMFVLLSPQQSISLLADFSARRGERALASVNSARLSGSIVMHQENGASWPQTLSLKNIPVIVKAN